MANWFVGLPVSAGSWFSPLVADAPPCLRVFHPEDLHATVAFLGNCGEERARAAFALAEGLSFEPVDALLGGIRPMGSPRTFSALSLLLTRGRDEAVAIIAALRDPMLEEAGAEPDTREPLPHITVARAGRRASPADRRAAIEWAQKKGIVGAPLTLDRLALYTWSDDRKTRLFRVACERPLR